MLPTNNRGWEGEISCCLRENSDLWALVGADPWSSSSYALYLREKSFILSIIPVPAIYEFATSYKEKLSLKLSSHGYI